MWRTSMGQVSHSHHHTSTKTLGRPNSVWHCSCTCDCWATQHPRSASCQHTMDRRLLSAMLCDSVVHGIPCSENRGRLRPSIGSKGSKMTTSSSHLCGHSTS